MTQALCDNLKRAPSWRWLRAMEIDGGGFKATKALDGSDGFRWIRRSLRFKRRFDAAGNQTPAIYAVVLADRPLFWAHSIWADEKSPVRWAIEARILAGESNEGIAEKLGTKADVIDVYANTFFDVRSKLQNMDYVLTVVLADAVTRGLQERHYDLLWKMLGYCPPNTTILERKALLKNVIAGRRSRTSEGSTPHDFLLTVLSNSPLKRT